MELVLAAAQLLSVSPARLDLFSLPGLYIQRHGGKNILTLIKYKYLAIATQINGWEDTGHVSNHT